MCAIRSDNAIISDTTLKKKSTCGLGVKVYSVCGPNKIGEVKASIVFTNKRNGGYAQKKNSVLVANEFLAVFKLSVKNIFCDDELVRYSSTEVKKDDVNMKLGTCFGQLHANPERAMLTSGVLNTTIFRSLLEFEGCWRTSNQVGAVISIVFINGVPDECFGRRRSRRDDTLKGNRVPVKAK